MASLRRHLMNVILPAVRESSGPEPQSPPLPWARIAACADVAFQHEDFEPWWQIRVLGKPYPAKDAHGVHQRQSLLHHIYSMSVPHLRRVVGLRAFGLKTFLPSQPMPIGLPQPLWQSKNYTPRFCVARRAAGDSSDDTRAEGTYLEEATLY